MRGVSQRLKIHQPGQQLAQRVDIERIGLIGRQKLIENAQKLLATRQRRSPEHLAHAAHGAHTFPELLQGLASQLATQVAGVVHLLFLRGGLCKAVGQYHSVHRAGAGAADALEDQVIVFQQRIQNPPGQRAMRAAPLQSEVDSVRGF